MCKASGELGIHRSRTKFLDVEKANLTYRKQRKHTKAQTRKITRRLLDLLGKILREMRKMEREQAVCETDCPRQGNKERGVRSQVQQHPGGWDIVH